MAAGDQVNLQDPVVDSVQVPRFESLPPYAPVMWSFPTGTLVLFQRFLTVAVQLVLPLLMVVGVQVTVVDVCSAEVRVTVTVPLSVV